MARIMRSQLGEKNTFLVPYGKVGRDFIDQLSKHINDWTNGTAMQHLGINAAILLLAVGLQKPSRKSKAKEHQECLEKRLKLWENGNIDCLLREGRMIQRRLQKSCRNDSPNKAKIFAKLVMEGANQFGATLFKRQWRRRCFTADR